MVVMPVFELVKKLPGMTSAAIPAWIVPPRCGVSLLPEAWDWLTADSQPAAPNRDAPTPRAAKPWSRVRRLTAPDRGRVGVDMDRPFEGLRAGCRPGHGMSGKRSRLRGGYIHRGVGAKMCVAAGRGVSPATRQVRE